MKILRLGRAGTMLEDDLGSIDLSPTRSGSLLVSLVRLARPRQWLKNLLVFAAPGAAGVLTEAHALQQTLVAFVVFCLVSTGTYFFNDALDHVADRLHPKKSQRPVASGLVPVRLAKLLGVAFIGTSLVVAIALSNWRLALATLTYAVISGAYSLWLKREPVIELVALASGFLIRAIAGAAAVGVAISNWFLIVAAFGSLFMAAGKRQAEYLELGDDVALHRIAMARYTQPFLSYVSTLSSGVAITAYCLWAFEKASASGGAIPWFQLSIVPFVLAILRYSLDLHTGRGGAPEDVVLEDRTLQVLAVVWLALFAVGVHVG